MSVNEEQIETAVTATVEAFGRLDVVVASAAIQLHDRDHTLHELDSEVWDETHAVNFRGVFLTCKHGLRQMVSQGDGGSIVIIASVTALDGGALCRRRRPDGVRGGALDSARTCQWHSAATMRSSQPHPGTPTAQSL